MSLLCFVSLASFDRSLGRALCFAFGKRWGRSGGDVAGVFVSANKAILFLGPPVVPLYPFLGEGSPTKIDYRKRGTQILTSTGGFSSWAIRSSPSSPPLCGCAAQAWGRATFRTVLHTQAAKSESAGLPDARCLRAFAVNHRFLAVRHFVAF